MKKIVITVIITAILTMISMLASCTAPVYEEQLYAMNTVISFKLPTDSVSGEKLVDECSGIIGDIEGAISRTLPESETYKFNRSEGAPAAGHVFSELVTKSLSASEVTGGSFDITVEPLVFLWNINGGGTEIPARNEIEEVLSHVGYKKIIKSGDSIGKTDPLVSIDFGAVGKGYACGLVIAYLRDAGLCGALVSFGGNVGVFGRKPDGECYLVGIRNPRETDDIVGYIRIEADESYVSVSGDYEKYFEKDGKRYHHIIDPKTGYPAESDIQSVAVLCGDGAYADILSTALFVMGKDKALEFYKGGKIEFEAVIITAEGITLTDGIKDKFISGEKN